ncbi:MAG: extracellular solute-binding protein, partial [Spirochaetes bacterium]|nr:extracellular solute-binding protein [Candidatus Ornithospirochaeta stercoravium]
MKRILVLLLCALLAVSAFAGGAGETAETAAAADSGKTVLEVYWWGAAVRNDLTQEAINLYMELNPDVQINAQFADWTGYWDKLSAMAAGGNMPDVVQMDYSYIEQY